MKKTILSYNLVSATKGEIELNQSVLRKILNKKIDGLIVRDFLTVARCKAIVESKDRITPELKQDVPFGSIFGKTLVGSSNSMNEYFEKAKLMNQEMETKVGLSILKELNDLFSNVIGINHARFENKEYVDGTIRCFSPKSGGLHAHAEAEFVNMLVEFEHIKEVAVLDRHINYLLILQEAEFGGDLELFNLRWHESPIELTGYQDFFDHYKTREKTISSYDSQSVTLQTGNLFLFNGFEIWHKISEIQGNKDRITLAGFIVKSANSDNYIIYN